MNYVMVPVPEEHVAATRHFLQWNVGKLPPESFEPEDVARFVGSLDDDAQSLLLIAAEGALDVSLLTVGDAADVTGLSVREVLGMSLELNEACRLSGGPPFIMAADVLPGDADVEPRDWRLNMPGDIAWRFLAAVGRRHRDSDA